MEDDVKEEFKLRKNDKNQTDLLQYIDVIPIDLVKYIEERNVILKKLKPDDVLRFLEAIDDYMLQGRKAVVNVAKQFHMIISKDFLSQLYGYNYYYLNLQLFLQTHTLVFSRFARTDS
jgi:hypothetical protein